jgi:hypothetical protein
MKKFLVIYNSSVSAMDQMKNATPEQAKAGMDAWMQWAGKAGSAIVDLGAPVGPAATFGGNRKRTDIKSNSAGYSILQAESMDALGKVLEGHPHFFSPDASIEAHELLPMPGM